MANTNFVVDKEKLEVIITRVFNVSPERLWKAYTDPEEIVQWWSDIIIDKHELKVGGVWRFVGKDEGSKNAFNGVFKELDEPKKIVRTFEYEPYPGHGMVETVTFDSQGDGKTLVTTTAKYSNINDLEGMVNSGMRNGSEAGLDRLAKLVEA